jgi:hypothetical protein
MACLALRNLLGQFRPGDLEDQNYAGQPQKLQGQGLKANEPAKQGIREDNGGGPHQQGGDEQVLAREAPAMRPSSGPGASPRHFA